MRLAKKLQEMTLRTGSVIASRAGKRYGELKTKTLFILNLNS